MIKIRTEYFKSWKDITTFINLNFSFFTGYRYRGHADSQWKLESTFTRALKEIQPYKDVKSMYEEHLINFKHNLRGRCSFDLNTISENELLAIGQHFGLYTPLLDWSYSSYVALFFALQGESKSGERCLWALHDSIIDDIKKIILSIMKV